MRSIKDFKKSDNPYEFDDEKFSQLIANSDKIVGGVFLSKIIPIKGQTWLTENALRKVTAIIHYRDDAWALRVGYEGDPFAGHIGTAWCPFIAGDIITVRSKKAECRIQISYVHPIQHQDAWVWRVEYRLV